ncbi:MAG: hypothetical protein M3220_16265 [Chloroflexota bacterium]|nr:hypothetical protein [Chloroflexota bacterium]
MQDLQSNEEINIVPYLLGIARRWYIIALVAILGALLAGALARMGPETYHASATVLAYGERPNLQFDARYGSSNTFEMDRLWRREGLRGLVTSYTIESLLPPEVVQAIVDDEDSGYVLGDLSRRIHTLENEGDLITIGAWGETAEEAELLANAWAEAYVSYINDLYGVDSAAVAISEQQVAEATANFEAAQKELEDFIAANDLYIVQDRIENLNALLDGNGTANAIRYTDLITRTQKLDLVLQDAASLREQIGSSETVALGENLAALALRSQAVGGETALGVQLQIDSATAFSVTPEEAQQELDRFIAGVQLQIESLRGKIEEAGLALVNNAPSPASNLTVAQLNEYYEAVNELRREEERLNGQLKALEQDRDVALETLQIVERKRAEQMIAEIQPAFQVRLASQAFEPTGPVPRGTLTKAMLGGITGAVLGTLLALLLTILSPLSFNRHPMNLEQPAADHPSYS